MAADFAVQLGAACELFHGLVVLRFVVARDGTVTGLRVVLNRLKRLAGNGPDLKVVVHGLLERVSELAFPTAGGTTQGCVARQLWRRPRSRFRAGDALTLFGFRPSRRSQRSRWPELA